jgi:hypothetical protein
MSKGNVVRSRAIRALQGEAQLVRRIGDGGSSNRRGRRNCRLTVAELASASVRKLGKAVLHIVPTVVTERARWMARAALTSASDAPPL